MTAGPGALSGLVDVSVVVSTRNREDRLGRAVASIMRAIDRATASGLACELVMVDNGSTDGTDALIKSLAREDARVRGVRAPEPGIGKARNRGLISSRGSVILFTDDDTVVPQEWVPRMSESVRLRGAPRRYAHRGLDLFGDVG